MKNIKYLIPARKGSKGLPGKNRLLFDETANLLKGKDVIVSTDDEVIIEKSKNINLMCISDQKKMHQTKQQQKNS